MTDTNLHSTVDPEQLRSAIRDRYADAARAAQTERASCGCGCSEPLEASISDNLYTTAEVEGVSETAVRASLGCGNPTALAELRPGEVVLDLGSGGGIDVLLSARRVGPAGKAYGLDMTPEMLELARRNQEESGITNAEFLHGEMENVPLPDNSVDVVISNCVINLAADKTRVLAEAARVLRPGGRFAVADVVTTRPVPGEVAGAMELWAACITGALQVDDYRARLQRAGFEQIEIELLRTYGPEDVGAGADALMRDLDIEPSTLHGLYASAFVRARKPA